MCSTARTVKMAISSLTQGIYWHAMKPEHPVTGDAYVDHYTGNMYMYHGNHWIQVSGSAGQGLSKAQHDNLPTEEELEKHPTLKSTWEEYLVVRKLLGLECGKTGSGKG